LLPKMHYKKDERVEVIRQAYSGLFQLASRGLFDKYVDFIDVYAEVNKQEQKKLYQEIIQHKETVMLAQYIRDRGMKEGMEQGMLIDAREMLIEVLSERFGRTSAKLSEQLENIDSRERLKALLRQALQVKSINEFENRL